MAEIELIRGAIRLNLPLHGAGGIPARRRGLRQHGLTDSCGLRPELDKLLAETMAAKICAFRPRRDAVGGPCGAVEQIRHHAGQCGALLKRIAGAAEPASPSCRLHA